MLDDINDAKPPPTLAELLASSRKEPPTPAEAAIEANNRILAIEAYAAYFVNLLRAVDRPARADMAAASLASYWRTARSSSGIKMEDVVEGPLAKIRPPKMQRNPGYDYRRQDTELQVALAGLAFLIENAATDAAAGSRRAKRRAGLRLPIENYVDARPEFPNGPEAEISPSTSKPARIPRRK